MEVRWLEQSLAEMGPETDWLSAAEVARLGNLRIPKRRQDWQLGRWTAKHAVAAYLQLPSDPSCLAAIEIRPAVSGAPEAFIDNEPAPVSISLSHRDGRAACAIAPAGTVLGCDLEVVEARCGAFVADYFTIEERTLLARVPDGEQSRALALLWSAKESTLKVLHTGLRLDPQCVAVTLGDDAGRIFAEPGPSSVLVQTWHGLGTCFEKRKFQGWWQCTGNFVRTLMSVPGSGSPMPLRSAS